MRRSAAIFLGLLLSVYGVGQSAKSGLADANAALQAGESDKALALLGSLPQPENTSAQAHNVRCRVYFTLEQWDAAAGECEQAVNMEAQNSDYHLWLGRALGERAEQASFVTAYSLAKRTRVEFETAVQIDARNADALADLGEFYSAAPSVVGGGVSKAEGVAAQLDKIDAVRAQELRGRIGAGNKDYGTAENAFKQAIAISPHPAFQWATLASFYRSRTRWTEMDEAVESCMKAEARDPHAGVALYNGASVLIQAKRNPALAVRMLQSYLAGPVKTEEAPAFIAHVWLARLLWQMGNSSAGWNERTAALTLAHEYVPAQTLKQ